jgi:hypothetical protein
MAYAPTYQGTCQVFDGYAASSCIVLFTSVFVRRKCMQTPLESEALKQVRLVEER